MVILGIEASTPMVSAAVLDGERLLAEVSGDGKGRQPLLALIDLALQGAGVTRKDLQGVACARGPGAFTGLRVGLSTAKGIAYALSLPLVGVSTLWAMASAFGPRVHVAALLDAKKGEVYGALYAPNGEALVSERAAPPEQMAASLSGVSVTGPLLCVGDGAPLVAPWLPGALVVPGALPRAREVARLGAMLLARGESQDPTAAIPTYLRLSEAEVKAQERAARGQG